MGFFCFGFFFSLCGGVCLFGGVSLSVNGRGGNPATISILEKAL